MNDRTPRGISHDIIQLARSCDYEEGHTHQVTYLAMRLFDELVAVHDLGPAERSLLAAAAMLHDIGWCRGQQGHHKSAYHIIVAQKPPSLSESEAAVVALVARYHRRSLPRQKHRPYAKLPPEGQRLVKRLAALLRIADGLDRGHASVVENLKCDVDESVVTIHLLTREAADLEIWGAQRKSDLFEDTFRRKVRLMHKPAGPASLPGIQ